MLGAKSEEAFRATKPEGPRDQTRGRRQQVRDGECAPGTWTIPRWVDRSCEDGHPVPPTPPDKDLLPPQGQGLLRVPLGGSQRGDERKGPGEQHHEGGKQQPDGEECQRHGRDLERQGWVTPEVSPVGYLRGSHPGSTAGPAVPPRMAGCVTGHLLPHRPVPS